MDYNYFDIENPEIFPPKKIWIWWDMSGELMDTTNDENEAKRWATSGHVIEYQRKQKVKAAQALRFGHE